MISETLEEQTLRAARMGGELRYALITVLAGSLVFAASLGAEETAAIRFSVSTFEVTGPNPLSDQATAELLDSFVGEDADLDRLRAAADTLEQAIRNKGFSFYRVVLPPQTITDRKVILRVTPLPVERVTILGNRYFTDDNIRASLPGLNEKASPNTKKLARTLRVANMNPGKQTAVKFRVLEGVRNAVHTEVSVRDERHHQLYGWLNNTGSAQTGDTRIGIGYQHSNLFRRDQVGALNFTTSVEQTEDVAQFAASYQIPFYRIDTLLNLYAIRSDVDTGTVAAFFDVSGRGNFYGGWLTYLLPSIGIYRHEVIMGIDDKLFDNNIVFEGQPIGVDVRSRPFSLRYAGTWGGPSRNAAWSVGYYNNLPSGSFNGDADYAATRAGATSSWSVVRYSGEIDFAIKRWNLIGRLNGQYADEPLIPGEQFGIGGVDSVRGIGERALTGDRATMFSVEVWAPAVVRGLRLLGFLDAGRIDQSNALAGEIDDTSVVTAGIGARWAWGRRLNAAIDFGYVLDEAAPVQITGIDGGDSKLHFNLLYRF